MRRVCTAFWADKRVLVTGASGFIGGAVARMLGDTGAEVHGTGWSQPPPPGVVGHKAHFPKDAHTLMAAVQPEIVIHLASPINLASGSAARDQMQRGIVQGTREVARATAQTGGHLVHVSSCAVYEGGEAPFSEGQALHPNSPYGQLKLASEHTVEAEIANGLQATIVRPFRTYGPGCTSGLIAQACRAAITGAPLSLTDGVQVREWNYVDSMAVGILSLAQPPTRGGIWNVGGGDRLSVSEIVARIFALAGSSTNALGVGVRPRRVGEVNRFWGDHRHIESRLGPLESTQLDDGLKATLAWHRSQERTAR